MIKPIFEARPIDHQRIVGDLKNLMTQLADEVKGDFRAATHFWDHQPTFITKGPGMRGSDLVVEVIPTTNVDIWNWVDQGTKPHQIVPRGPGYPLRFQRDYRAHTQTYTMYSGPGGKSGPIVVAWKVSHPGIKARKFTELTAANHQAWWNQKVYLIFYRYGAEALAKPAGRLGRIGT